MTNDKMIGMICVTSLACGLVVASYFISPIPENIVSTVQQVITGIFGAVVGYNLKDLK